MKFLRLFSVLFVMVPSAWATEPAFEIRAVADRPGPATQEYSQAVTGERKPEKIYLEQEVLLGIAAVRSAAAELSQASQWVIQVNFTGAGSEQFIAITTKYLDKRLAILINGKLRCAPVVRGVIGRSVEISGDFTADEATSLAADLNAAVAKAAAATPDSP